MNVDKNAKLKSRTGAFALSAIRLVQNLPRDMVCSVLAKQFVRCATSVGANYRASCRAKSTADFIAKMGIVEEEADECGYWLDLLVQAGYLAPETAAPLIQEADELVAIVVTSIRTARSNGGIKPR